MHKKMIGVVLAVCVFFFAGFVYGAEVAKIAVVDFQRIIDTSNAGKRSSEEIKGEGKKMEQVLKEKETEVEEIKKTLEQKALVMSQEARDEKEQALRVKANDLVSLKKRYLDVLKDLNMKLSNQIKKDVFEVVEAIGKREGYLLIFEKRVGGIIYNPNAIEITDKVIEEYNALDAKKVKEPEKK
jgi:outer membrane protein